MSLPYRLETYSINVLATPSGSPQDDAGADIPPGSTFIAPQHPLQNFPGPQPSRYFELLSIFLPVIVSYTLAGAPAFPDSFSLTVSLFEQQSRVWSSSKDIQLVAAGANIIGTLFSETFSDPIPVIYDPSVLSLGVQVLNSSRQILSHSGPSFTEVQLNNIVIGGVISGPPFGQGTINYRNVH